MKKSLLSTGWKLLAPGSEDFVPTTLPNDYGISQPRTPNAPGGARNGFFQGGSARYINYLNVSDSSDHLILDVDGAYMHADVKCNDHLIAMHHHGYAPFLVDLTPKLRRGHLNKLEIATHAFQPSTRWYSGAGLYRDVFLWTGGAVRVEPRDIFITTPDVSDHRATVNIDYALTADREGDAVVTAVIESLTATGTAHVQPGVKTPLTLTFTIAAPRLWDTESPYLYTVQTTIAVNGMVTDTAENTFGIRSIAADAENGFRLNGKPLKLRGGCIHHDHGVLGAAAYPAAEFRKASRLKQAGFNALRIAHNPPSTALLEACDRLGIIVMDEAFDMWNAPKGALDYHLWFGQCWQQDLSAMVLRDRNHPCVICYSIGNEIPETAGMSDCAVWSARLAAEIRRHDSTRFTTLAIWGVSLHDDPADPEDYREQFRAEHITLDAKGHDISWADRTEATYAPHDICGYNYYYGRYAADHARYPKRVIWGSETHAIHFYDSWHTVLDNNYVIGDFTWTAYDNLGEAGTGRSAWARDGVITHISLADYPWRSCYQGDLDLCGYRRPQSYFREAVWLGHTEPRIFTTHPEHYGEGFSGTGWHWYDVLDTWTFEEDYLGKPVLCEVYTDADEIEWSLNGTSLGRTKPEKAIARMTVPYEKGTLTAIAFKDGKAVASSSLQTVGAAAAVAVEAEKQTLAADNRDLCYVDITINDARGNRIPNAKNELICEVAGGTLLGIFSGDPANEDAYTSSTCHAFEGRAVAIVRTATPGVVTITVKANGLCSGATAVLAEPHE